MLLTKPEAQYFESYRSALVRLSSIPEETFYKSEIEDLDEVVKDVPAFFARLDDPEGVAGDIKLPNGAFVPRLPSFYRWMWDGEVCGTINFRWKKGSTKLPPHCLGHIGYGVFPWKRGLGYATEALRQVLIEIEPLNMPFVEVTTNLDNFASQQVILKNGGVLFEQFTKTEISGGGEGLRYRIALD
ncbi:MAG: GNAT family N-acetyltransferase [Streptomycetaceae bacterium]|nr:MAG: GNAT family N-acetyltransferase [Streptomycetaceae bacterium]